MASDGQDCLAALKNELAFLEKGGYRQTTRAAWRPHFIFQDSPTCLNFDPAETPRPCSECGMLQFVPEHLRAQKIPCRYIPIAEHGRTIDWFYRSGTEDELEAALGHWLKSTIARLELEQAERVRPGEAPEIHVKGYFANGG